MPEKRNQRRYILGKYIHDLPVLEKGHSGGSGINPAGLPVLSNFNFRNGLTSRLVTSLLRRRDFAFVISMTGLPHQSVVYT